MPRKPKEENDQLAKAIGARLEIAMRRRGVTVSDLHKLTGISRTVLLAYTRGNYAPGARELKLLCEHLDASPTLLLFGSETPQQSPYRIGDLAITSEVGRAVTYIMLLAQLTQREQESLLALAEGLVEARSPKEHRTIVAAVSAILENEQLMQGLSGVFSSIGPVIDEHGGDLEATMRERIDSSH